MSEKLPAQADRSPASLVADALTFSGKPANRMILLGDPKWGKNSFKKPTYFYLNILTVEEIDLY